MAKIIVTPLAGTSKREGRARSTEGTQLMLARVRTCAISGIDAIDVDVEVQVQSGTRRFSIIGLGDGAIREARDRVTSAIGHSGFAMPDQVLVNLAPAEVRKEGASFDLAVALGILIASGQISGEKAKDRMFHGELSLDGTIRPVRGSVALALQATSSATREIVIPSDNVEEAALIPGVEIQGVGSLVELVGYLENNFLPAKISLTNSKSKREKTYQRLVSDVWGQAQAKRALLIAASGGHNALLIGPPGCGKSMLAERFGSLLPPLTNEELIEVVRIHSIAGLPVRSYFDGGRPYRNPHHVISDVGLIGGGSTPKPGEISLAHNGVLFLDELPEFRRSAIDALRSPLETGMVRITRAKASLAFPAHFQLVGAMNPCPCGRLGLKNTTCLCSALTIAAYLKKLSQPILDRIDLHVDLEPVPITVMRELGGNHNANGDDKARELVVMSRDRQYARQGKLNGVLESAEIGTGLKIRSAAVCMLENAAARIGLSARGFVRMIRVASTLRDLEGDEYIEERHMAEAIGFRALERIERYCGAA